MAEKLLSTGKAADYVGLSFSGIKNAVKRGELTPIVLPSGRWRFTESELRKFLGIDNDTTDAVALYVRVSSSSEEQKSSLVNQESILRASTNRPIYGVYTDTASGLNTKRRGLNKLLDDARLGKFSTVLVTHQDRLTRFGFEYIARELSMSDVDIVTLETFVDKSAEQELLEDIMGLLASFTGRMYGLRSRNNKRKLLEKMEELNDRENSNE